MKELKTGFKFALTPNQKGVLDEWAGANGVSASAILSAAIGILGNIPLSRKELVVENALRGALHAPPSASEAQLERRIAAVEARLAVLEAGASIGDESVFAQVPHAPRRVVRRVAA